MLRAIAVTALAAAALGCGGSPTGGDAGVQDGPAASDARVDGPAGTGGLAFEFVAQPALPEVSADLFVDELRIDLRNVRVIGDSAPGDARTSVAELQLDWRPGDPPPSIAFAAAPPGIYSSFYARLGTATAGEQRFEIRGRVRIGGVLVPFRIENDLASAQISVDLTGLVVAGEARVATIAVSLVFLSAVRWDQVESEGGELLIEADDPQMAAIVAGIVTAFSFTGVR